MKPHPLWGIVAGLALLPGAAGARALSVDVWTDRGNDAVYQPGDEMQIKVRASADAYALVYEIDAEGAIHVLFPYQKHGAMLEGRHTYRIPSDDSDVELVVQGTVGQAYIVAIVSEEPFGPLPWYLRPYNPQAEGVGYAGRPEDDEEGVSSEGRIVGDPFVAMERIRRRVLQDPDDAHGFASSYANYYVHQEVRYPRYLCYDCHRPGRWAWWDGFDPYYANCSVFDFRVNWAWDWGPSYWFGRVPYFVYVYRTDCPPRYHRRYTQGYWYSSWDGWNHWCDLWGASALTRYKSPPPPSYVPPVKYGPRTGWGPAQPAPPGFLVSETRKRNGIPVPTPIGRRTEVRGGTGDDDRFGGGLRKPPAGRMPSDEPRVESPNSPGRGRSRSDGPPMPVLTPREDPEPRTVPRRPEDVSPGGRRPREEQAPPPRVEPKRDERPAPKVEQPREKPKGEPAQRPRDEGPPRGKRGGG